MSTTVVQRPPLTQGLHRTLLPLLAVLAVGLLANLGFHVSQDANAATNNVAVNANLGAVAPTVTDGCAGAISIAFSMSAYTAGSCTITFGSTNSSGITLSVDDNTQADAFMPQNANNFADASADCAALAAADQVGYKVLTGGTAAVNKCVASATGNSQLSDVPNDVPGITGADVACTTTAIGTQTCPIEVGMFETGGDAIAGAYTGTIAFTAA